MAHAPDGGDGGGSARAEGGWTRGQVVAIVAGNAVPLLGVYVWGWDPLAVLIIYWVETGLMGMFTAAKIALALRRYRPVPGRRLLYRQVIRKGSRSFATEEMPRGRVLPYFVLGYTTAMAIVMAIGVGVLGEDEILAVFAQLADDPWGWTVLLGVLVVEHAIAAYVDYFRGPRWARSDATFHFWRPMGRFALFFALIMAGGVILNFFSPTYLIFLFVGLKLIGELFTVPFQGAAWERRDSVKVAVG